MNEYKVRVQDLGWHGFITQADHYHDFHFKSAESLKDFAKRLAQEGFEDPDSDKWIMPGAIMWVELTK